MPDPDLRRDLPALLDRWVCAGLISEDQAESIRLDQDGRALAARTSLLTEALGYLGGVLMLVGSVLLASRYWDDTPLAVQLGLVATTTVLLLIAGPAVPARLGEVGDRARAVLWALSVASFAGFLAIGGAEWLHDEDLALLVGSGTAVYAAVLWRRRSTGLQLAALFGALLATVAAAAAEVSDGDQAPGLAIWALALVWLALAWRGGLGPRRVAYILGSAGALFGAATTTGQDWGLVLAVVTAAGLVGVAVALGDLVVLAIGAAGTLLFLPAATARLFPGALAAPVALLLAGVVLLVAARKTTHRRD